MNIPFSITEHSFRGPSGMVTCKVPFGGTCPCKTLGAVKDAETTDYTSLETSCASLSSYVKMKTIIEPNL